MAQSLHRQLPVAANDILAKYQPAASGDTPAPPLSIELLQAAALGDQEACSHVAHSGLDLSVVAKDLFAHADMAKNDADAIAAARERRGGPTLADEARTDAQADAGWDALLNAHSLILKAADMTTIDDTARSQATTLGPPTHNVAVDDKVVALTADQSIAAWARKHDNDGRPDDGAEHLNLTKMIRGMVTADWRGAAREFKAYTEGTSSAGGVLVPTPLSGQIIDLARAKTRVIQAGARTVPMTSQTLKMARLTADPSPGWRSEAASITESAGTLDSITFTARSLACLSKISWELLEDAENIGDVARDGFVNSIAHEIDRVALRGSGTPPEPKGVKNTSGITTTILGGGSNGDTPANFDFLVDAIQVLRNANFEPSAVIDSPRTETTLAKLKDTTNQPLQAPDAVKALPRLPTNQIGNAYTVGESTNCSEVYVGQWDHLLIGMRTELRIIPLTERYADTGELGLVAWIRADIQLARPTAFNVITGVRP